MAHNASAGDQPLEAYRDYLRLRGAEEVLKDHVHAKRLTVLLRSPQNHQIFRKGLEHRDPLIAANAIIGVIKVTTYLLDRQIRRLQRDFLQEGGLRERMMRARLRERKRQNDSGTEGTQGTEGT